MRKNWIVLVILAGFFLVLMLFAIKPTPQQNSGSSNTANTSATVMTNNEAEKFFRATEIISNQLPNSVSFWTEADCPDAGQWAYTVPAGYSLASCQNGNKGSHSGCPTCIMSQISLKSESEQPPQQTQTSAQPSNNTLTSVIAEWHPFIAYIVCNFNYADGTPYSMQGSGTVSKTTDSIIIATNKHVVTDINGYGASSCSASFPLDPNRTPLTWATNDYYIYPNLDFAYLPINNPSSYITNLANSVTNYCAVQPPLGEGIVILGYPTNGSKTDITATEGIISAYEGNYYITSAKVDHGNSGGAAIDIKNDCYLGIPTYFVGDVESLARILKWQAWK